MFSCPSEKTIVALPAVVCVWLLSCKPMMSARFFAVAALFTTTSVAHADDTFRCPTGRLIRVGEPLADARGKCGPPSHSSQRTEKQRVRERGPDALDGTPVYIDREIDVAVEEWLFDQGNQRFVRALRFENGRLVSITTGRYGGGDK
jgi:hypothetical protein